MLQKRQARVQMSPRIMKVAVPSEKHVPLLGHAAEAHTVFSPWSAMAPSTKLARSPMAKRLILNQLGFFKG
jgi:hypothetical protein